jgi:hypothetical protein
MKIVLIVVYVLIIAGAACHHSNAEVAANESAARRETSEQIDGQTASRVAIRAAMTTLPRPIQDYEVSVCEQASLWRVYFELKENADNVWEFVVSKRGAQVFEQRQLNISGDDLSPFERTSTILSKSEALRIAEKDAATVYSPLNRFIVTACELKKVWRVIYQRKELITAGGPEYIIEKHGGKIVEKRYNQ